MEEEEVMDEYELNEDILNLYIAFFNRAPDYNGYKFWENLIENENRSLENIAYTLSLNTQSLIYIQ